MSSRPIYSFPEPEKTTSWRDRDTPVTPMVDHDLESAKRRTELIKERMSPPGALGLPPLLEKHRLQFGIPDGAFASQALFDRIHVFPIDAGEHGQEEKTAGGIIKPNMTKLRDKQEGNRGVIISAGLTAMDRLMSHGVELGDIIVTNKNVPFARRCEEISNFLMFYLVMRDGDLGSDESLMARIRSKEIRIVDCGGAEKYEHQIADAAGNVKKKESVWITDTW